MNPADLFALMQQDPGQARALMEAAMSERAASDPRFGLLMQMFGQQLGGARAPSDELPDPVAEQLDDLKAALSNAYEQLDELAAALGACAVCWGDADDCSACRGRGRPGWRVPDAKLFRALIAPAVRRRAALAPPVITIDRKQSDQPEGEDP